MDSANFRSLYPISRRKGIYLFEEGKKFLNFSSNDYLNIGTNQALTKEFLTFLLEKELYGEALFSSSSSRLLSGNSAAFTRLEKTLAKWYKKEAALLFNSGYQANMGIISGLMQKGDAVFSDKLNHNSIVAGMLHAESKFYRYKHLDYNHLEDLLKKYRSLHKKALLVTESVFSMDGDKADLSALITLKEKYACIILLDEAHGVGVYGKNACGLCTEDETILPKIDIVMSAMGKALGSHGAFCTANAEIIQTLINKAPTFIFSTAQAPIQILWSEFILTRHFDFLLSQQQKLHRLMQACGLSSHIVPHIVGESKDCVNMSAYLKEQGFYVLPVRPPTVPQHTARLRLSFCADMQKEHVDALFRAIHSFPNKENMQCNANG